MRRASAFLFRPLSFFCVISCIALILAGHALRSAKAQDAPPPPAVLTPTQVVDQIMTLIGQGRIDDAVSMMEGLKTQSDMRQAARTHLIALRNDEGAYRGYDIAATQRFSGQFEIVNVLAYYDDQPVLVRLHFYRPQLRDDIKWMVLDLEVMTSLHEMTEVLKDTPIDYVAHKK
jgi:hypothetical protein